MESSAPPILLLLKSFHSITQVRVFFHSKTHQTNRRRWRLMPKATLPLYIPDALFLRMLFFFWWRWRLDDTTRGPVTVRLFLSCFRRMRPHLGLWPGVGWIGTWGIMADVDPDTLLEWLQMGQGDERDMQLIALEQLCMLLLMSDNVDRCFET